MIGFSSFLLLFLTTHVTPGFRDVRFELSASTPLPARTSDEARQRLARTQAAARAGDGKGAFGQRVPIFTLVSD